MDFFLSGSIYIEASLKQSLCSAQDLGLQAVFGNDKTGKFCIFKPVEYQMSISRPIFPKPALWKPTQVDYSSQYFFYKKPTSAI